MLIVRPGFTIFFFFFLALHLLFVIPFEVTYSGEFYNLHLTVLCDVGLLPPIRLWTKCMD